MNRILFISFLIVIFQTGALGQNIKPYNESTSHFQTATPIDTTRGNFKFKNMFRAYRKATTGFTTMTSTQTKLERDIRSFANKQGKSFILLGSQFSHPPYLLGNYPRMEIIFVLVDEEK